MNTSVARLVSPVAADFRQGRYAGQPVAFLTQHGKQRVVQPVLDGALGCRVELVSGFDTDQLGTFTRDVARAGTQLEAARKKAREGMRRSGYRLGIASEGSFGPDPVIGFFPWNLEMMIWIDDDLDLEVVGVASSRDTNHSQFSSREWQRIEEFALQARFPEHHLIVRPCDEHDNRMRKGLADWNSLRAAFDWAGRFSADGTVFVETDMRAHANPKRMLVIEEAARELAQRLLSTCSCCGLPGFARTRQIPGRRCETCRQPTNAPIAWEYGCLKCPYRETRPLENASQPVSPAECPHCNP